MLHIYNIKISNGNFIINAQDDILYDLLPFRIPWTFRFDIMEDDNQSNNMLDYFMSGDCNQFDTAKCYFTSKPPEILDWIKSYMNNKETYII